MESQALGNYLVRHTLDIERPKRSVLYWGPAKTGKTHAMLTWPRPFVIYWDENLSTLLKFDVPFIQKNKSGGNLTFTDFEKDILPAIKNRTLDCDTIVFDSYSFCSQRLRQATQGSADKMPIHKWGAIMDRMWDATKEMVECTQPDPNNPDRRTYNVVASVHDRDKIDRDGGVIKIDAAIQGQFKDWLPRFFDTVLVTEVELENKVMPNGKVAKAPNYLVNTVPPNDLWVCGDGVGGGLGDKPANAAPSMPQALPARLSGDYNSLMKAWGINTKESK